MAELNQKERSTGADVWPQVSVRPFVFSMNMAEPFTFNMNPIFAALMDKRSREAGGVPRSRVAQEGAGGAGRAPVLQAELGQALGQRDHEVPGADREAGCGDRERARRSAARRDPDLAVLENLETRFRSILANDDQDAIGWLLQQDGMLIGLSDAGAHVGNCATRAWRPTCSASGYATAA